MWVCISPVSTPCDENTVPSMSYRMTIIVAVTRKLCAFKLAPASRRGQKAQGKDTLRQ